MRPLGGGSRVGIQHSWLSAAAIALAFASWSPSHAESTAELDGASESSADPTTASYESTDRTRRHGGYLDREALGSDFVLDEEIQTYVWDIEHLFFVMNQDVTPVFKQMLRDGDPEVAARFLALDFTGEVFSGPGRTFEDGPVKADYWDEEHESTREVGRADFLRAFADLGRAFKQVDHVGSHIDYLTPDTRFDLEGSWKARWSFHVAGLLQDGSRANHRFEMRLDLSSVAEDMGETTGWITRAEFYQGRLTRSPSLLLADITASTGIRVDALHDNWNQSEPPFHPLPGISRMFDYDRDGLPDLLLTNLMPSPQRLFLYRGLGDGTFAEVTFEAGLDQLARLPASVQITGVLVADLDNDGFEDLMVTGDERTATSFQSQTLVIRNQEGRSFSMVDESVHRFNERFRMPIRGVAVADYDGDGLVDLYLGTAGRPPPAKWRKPRWIGDRSSPEGLLLRNLGGFRFEDATGKAKMSGEFVDTFSANWLDLEPDGDADLFVGNHIGANLMWVNQGDGTFRLQPQPLGYGGFSMGSATGDLDHDGDPDLYVANMYTSAGGRIIDNLAPEDYPPGVYGLIRGFATGNELYLNHVTKPLEPIAQYVEVANSGWAYGPELVDLDGDGDLDVYSPAGYQSVERGKPDG